MCSVQENRDEITLLHLAIIEGSIPFLFYDFCTNLCPPVFSSIFRRKIDTPRGRLFTIRKSIVIFRSAIFLACLAIVTRLAQCLPVRFTPHECLITTMGNDMVHHRCRNVSALSHTAYTHGVLAEVGFAQPLPLAAVATFGS